ncbi:RNA-directed DNA polymerase [Bacillus subtilis]|uniref:RNA-directed DNA polymerase n=1 Tax=Bacillus subtilis TaxID=1423 RepID=UPI003F8496EC
MEKKISQILMEDGFFSKELPSEFNSNSLANALEQIDVSKSKLSKQVVNKWSKLVQYSIPKKNNFRRIAAIPHPLHYIKLSKVIEENWIELETHYEKSKVSLTKIEFSNGKLKNKYSFNKKQDIRLDNLSFNRYILSIDVNRYYPSIYTHSIPWALHTKAVAKANSKDMNYLGNKIDLEVRNMQDGQTMGIPIGPLTSAIIQEIIGTSIDEEFQKLMGKEIPGFRYTDDMEYYFSTLEEANKALSIMTKLLKDYNLDTNVEKTRIVKLPLEIDTSWVYFFKNFKFKNSKERDIQILLEKNDLKEYFNQIFNYQIEISDKGIGKYALKVPRNRIVYKENWSILQSLLLQTALVDSTVIPTVFEIIESYKYKGYEMEIDKLSLFVHSVINENLELNNDYEIIWALSFANKLMICLDKETTEKLCEYENPLINILVMILNDKNLIHASVDFSNYKSFIANNDLYDENWIFLYECCINGWLDKDSSILSNDNFFKQLLQHNISFITPDYSAVKVEVKNILSSLCIKKYSTGSIKNLRELLEDIISEYQINLEEEFKDSICESIQSKIEKIGAEPEEETEARPEEETEARPEEETEARPEEETEAEPEEETEAEPEEETEAEPEEETEAKPEEEIKTEDMMEFSNWSKLFLLSKMRNKQIRFSVEDEY